MVYVLNYGFPAKAGLDFTGNGRLPFYLISFITKMRTDSANPYPFCVDGFSSPPKEHGLFRRTKKARLIRKSFSVLPNLCFSVSSSYNFMLFLISSTRMGLLSEMKIWSSP